MPLHLNDDKVGYIRRCPLFAGIEAGPLENLLNAAVLVRLGPGDRLPAFAATSPAIWLVQDGLASLTYGDASGKDATVLLLGPGDLFGNQPNPAAAEFGQSVVALRPSVLARIPRSPWETLLHRHPRLACRVAEASWRRIAQLQQRLADIMTKPVHQRLAALLLKTTWAYGQANADGSRDLGLALTHEDLARLVGSSREMVSKVMGQFRAQGWIRSARKTVILQDLEALGGVATATIDSPERRCKRRTVGYIRKGSPPAKETG